MDQQWRYEFVEALYELPLIALVYKAQTIHKQHFAANEMQLSTLLSVKTGACPEDCAYCPQSAHYKTGLEQEKLLAVDQVVAQANTAKAKGATRFCMGAAWRNPPKRDFPQVLAMIKAVKNIGLETCVTLGMLDEAQAAALKEVGLDFYNHNLDTSPSYYKKLITTRTYDDRLTTLENVRKAGIKVCCGGIVGMGEARQDRIALLLQLANLAPPPESVPINRLIAMKGTPLGKVPPIDNFELIRTIAVARIMMPTSVVRLSAGREAMSEELQAWCFMAGVNSLFFGEKLLTAANPANNQDRSLLNKLGIRPQQISSD